MPIVNLVLIKTKNRIFKVDKEVVQVIFNSRYIINIYFRSLTNKIFNKINKIMNRIDHFVIN